MNCLTIKPVPLSEIRNFVELHHYSKSVNGVKISNCFGVYLFNSLVGAVIYGALSTTAWKRFAKCEKEVIELRRLVLIDELPRNSESYVISKTIKWLIKNTDFTVIVSYADPAHGHTGVIYHASNFEYLGVTSSDKGFYDTETGKTYHSRALRTKYKGDYKPFVKKLRLKLANGELIETILPGKHCFVYKMRNRNEHKRHNRRQAGEQSAVGAGQGKL